MYKIKNIIILTSLVFTTFLNANQENLNQENPNLKSITTLENPIQEDTTKAIQQNVPIEENITKNITENNTIEKKEVLKKEIVPNTYDPKDILIGFYGRPFAKSLGILGELDIDALTKKNEISKKRV